MATSSSSSTSTPALSRGPSRSPDFFREVADTPLLPRRSGVLSPSVSLSHLGRQLGLDRELQSVLDGESRRFEVRVARLLAARRGRQPSKRASNASAARRVDEVTGEERGTKRARVGKVKAQAKAGSVVVEKPRSGRGRARGKVAGK